MESSVLQCEASHPICSVSCTPIAQAQCFTGFNISLTVLEPVDGRGTSSPILQMRKLRYLLFVRHRVLWNKQKQNWRDLNSYSETYIRRFDFLAPSVFIGEKASFHSYWSPFESHRRERWLKTEGPWVAFWSSLSSMAVESLEKSVSIKLCEYPLSPCCVLCSNYKAAFLPYLLHCYAQGRNRYQGTKKFKL